MAQQKSLIKLEGKIGDLSFFRTKDGYQARAAGGVDGKRIKTDPNYQRTRENNTEFTTVALASKKMRDTLRGIILQTSDPKMAIRLNGRFFRIVKSDGINGRGERKVLPENTQMLKDFNFNEAALLNNTLLHNPAFEMDRAAGTASVSVGALKPEQAIVSPKGATHFCFSAGLATINFEGDEGSELVTALSELIPIREDLPEQSLSLALTNAGTDPMFLLFGIAFYQQLNGVYYPLNNGAFNALSIVAVNAS